MVIFRTWLFCILFEKYCEYLYQILWQVLQVLTEYLAHGLHYELTANRTRQHDKFLLPVHYMPNVHDLAASNKRR